MKSARLKTSCQHWKFVTLCGVATWNLASVGFLCYLCLFVFKRWFLEYIYSKEF